MNKKESFLKAVQILAPDDQFILQSAHCVAEESLPDTPGGAALEFVVAMQRLTRPAWQCKTRFKSSSPRTDSPGTWIYPKHSGFSRFRHSGVAGALERILALAELQS